MKILILGVGFDKGGTSIVVKNISPILMKRHEVTILTNEKDSLDLTCNKLIQLKSSSFPFSQYAYMPKLKEIIKNKKLNEYDIIHIFDYPQFGADYITLKKNKILPPIVLNTHGSIHQFSEFPLSFFKKIHNMIMLRYKNRISKFIALTNAEKKHLIHYGIDEKNIKIIDLGVKSENIIHQEVDEKSIIYLGRLAKTKNVEILIEAFSKCNTENVKLILAGPDYGMLNKLKNLVTKLGIENKVIFKGAVSEKEKKKLFSEGTIFVHPSLEDIFSLALIEAAASGIPCVAFDVEGNSEILENKVSGILIKNNDVKSLSIELDNLLNDKKLRMKISENAKKNITQKFDWHKTVKQLEEIYLEAIEENNQKYVE